jgi:predicted ABC-type ATPase
LPRLYLIAGCNGCGKTTFIHSPEYLQAVEQFDPDAQFATLGSWRAVTRKLREYLSTGIDLVLETTLSGRTILKHIGQAKRDGYELHLTFIGTDAPEINIARIRTRTALGGHHISDNDVKRRWYTSLANLPIVAALADSTLVLDNSRAQEQAQGAFLVVARLQVGDNFVASDSPAWAHSVLRKLAPTEDDAGSD